VTCSAIFDIGLVFLKQLKPEHGVSVLYPYLFLKSSIAFKISSESSLNLSVATTMTNFSSLPDYLQQKARPARKVNTVFS
jgi:hypothetical protein